LRAGCLVAVDAARTVLPAPNLLFWQPVVSGRQFLQHLLRLRVAAQMMGSTDEKRSDTRELAARFAQGHAVEIAGYELSPALALGLDASELNEVPGQGRVVWIEISSAKEPELSPAAKKRIETWQSAGRRVDAHVLTAPPFWQTQEIVESAELVEATLAAMSAAST
jgi:exosortase A-associated hydrolase 2